MSIVTDHWIITIADLGKTEGRSEVRWGGSMKRTHKSTEAKQSPN